MKVMVIVQQRWRHQSLMLRAVRRGDLASLVSLLDSGLDCDQTFSLGGWRRPAVCLALELGHVKLVAELCRRRCSVSVLDQGGLTPLMLAASLGLTEIVEVLLYNRAEVDSVVGDTGETALHLATAGSFHHTARLLLEHGAAVNKQDKEGRTSLMYAAMQGNLELVKTLVEHGARRDLRDISGSTALLLYCTSRQVSLPLLHLLSSPTSVNIPNKAGWGPLVSLVSSDHHNKEEAVLCLLNSGADVKVRPSPLDLALLRGDTDLASVLLAAGATCSLSSSQR